MHATTRRNVAEQAVRTVGGASFARGARWGRAARALFCPPPPPPPVTSRDASERLASRARPSCVVRRASRAAAIAAVLAVAPLLALPFHAHAQSGSAATLVTNEAGTESEFGDSSIYAQAFTTGSHPEGYRLDAVWLKAAEGTNYKEDHTHVVIVPDQNVSAGPNEEWVRLLSPAALGGSDFERFEAPSGTILKPDRTYYVAVNLLIHDETDFRVTAALTKSVDEQSGLGWSLADHRLVWDVDVPVPPEGWTQSTDVLRMRLTGCEASGPHAEATLASNTAQALETSGLQVLNAAGSRITRAVGFTTGSDQDGYFVSQVQVHFASGIDGADDVRVSIRESDSGVPAAGDPLYSLVNPGTIENGQLNTFTMPADKTGKLEKGTDYFLVVSTPSGSFFIGQTTSTDNDPPACGYDAWGISGTSLVRSDGGPWATHSGGRPSMAIVGAVAPFLDGLSLLDHNLDELPLNEAFHWRRSEHTADVDNSVITIKPVTTDPGTTFDYLLANDVVLPDVSTDPGFQARLGVGNNTFKIQVNTDGTDAAATHLVTVRRTEPAVAPDSALKPDAVEAGGNFRLLFVSSTTKDMQAQSNVELENFYVRERGNYDFNEHVRAAAAAGHPDIRAYSADFRVVGSTPSHHSAVSAPQRLRVNTGMTSKHPDAPIYWLSTAGERNSVADDYEDFFDRRWGDPSARTESGAATAMGPNDRPPVATGSRLDGSPDVGAELASHLAVVVGTDAVPLISGWSLLGHDLLPWVGNDLLGQYRFLGLSPVLRVDGDDPVPDVLVTNAGERDYLEFTGTGIYLQQFTTGPAGVGLPVGGGLVARAIREAIQG